MSIEKFERGINRRAIREKGRDVAAAAQDHQFGRHARLVEQRLVVGRVIQRHQPIDAAVIEEYGRIAGADVANRRSGFIFGELLAARSANQLWNQCAAGTLGEIAGHRSEEHTSELQSLMRISYAVFCLKKKKQ